MKKSFILLLGIALLCNFSVSAQIVVKYEQYFEGSAKDGQYTIQDTARLVTDHYVSYNHSMRLIPSKQSAVTVTLGAIKVEPTQNFARLGFKHIAKILANDIDDPRYYGGYIQYRKKVNSTWQAWIDLTSSNYDNTWGGGASALNRSSFNTSSYPEPYPTGWGGNVNNVPPNNCWKQEYFDISNLTDIGQVADSMQFQFVLPKHKADNYTPFYGWLLDDIKISLSNVEMKPPAIKVESYPQPVDYPGNRDVTIEASISDDSKVKVVGRILRYKYGNDNWVSVPLNLKSAGSSTLQASIPFKGYDRLISWQVVAMDSSANQNRATFPGDSNIYMQLRFVRSAADSAGKDIRDKTDMDTVSPYPFSIYYGLGKSQFIYTAEKLKSHGYTAGNISAVSFDFWYKGDRGKGEKLENLTIKIGELDPNTTITTNFLTNLKTVYSDSYIMPQAGWNAIVFSDNFQWNGSSDIVLQVCYRGPKNMAVPNPDDLGVRWMSGDPSKFSLHYETFISSTRETACDQSSASPKDGLESIGGRPEVRFSTVPNQKLDYDAGIDSFVDVPEKVTPTDLIPIKVKLKNYGLRPLTEVVIHYVIDPTNAGGSRVENIFPWTGNLSPDSSVVVTINTGYRFPTGYKIIDVWTDSIINNPTVHPDFEPLNNRKRAALVSCGPPISGAKFIEKIGGDYPSIQGALEVMKYCDISDSVTFTIGAGIWNEQLVFHTIPSISAINKVIFKVANPEYDSVTVTSKITNDSPLVDLTEAKYISFKDINFVLESALTTSSLAFLGSSTNHISFENCSFKSVTPSERGLLYVVNSENIQVKNCTFSGAKYGVYLTGDVQAKSSGNSILNSGFENQTSNAIRAMYQKNLYIGGNLLNSLADQGESILWIEKCSNSIKIEKNKVVAFNGASCLKISDVDGANDTIFVANNTFSSIGNARNVVSLEEGKGIKFVYNSLLSQSVLQDAYVLDASNYELSNSEFYNNIFSSQDKGGIIAFKQMGTTRFNNNDYYAKSGIFGKYGVEAILSFDAWKTKTKQDTNSLNILPLYASNVNLKTYNVELFEKGKALSYIKEDIEGTPRSTTMPCIGAYEYQQLSSNIAVKEVLSPLSSCSLTSSTNVTLLLRNEGTQPIAAGSIRVFYALAGGVSVADTVKTAINPGDTSSFTFSKKVDLSVVNKMKDSTFYMRTWAALDNDLDNTNDTILSIIQSRYQLPAPVVNSNTFFTKSGTPLTISIERQDSSTTLYWFSNAESNLPIAVGNTYPIGGLNKDTTYYISQKEGRPILKFTEIQVRPQGAGMTSPIPDWLHANSAIEISNLGNQDINLSGYKLRLLIPADSPTPKEYLFGSFTIRKNSSIVVQLGMQGSPIEGTTVYARDLKSINANTNCSIGLYDNSSSPKIIDAIVLNQDTSKSWNIPDSIWSGRIIIQPTTAGIKRKTAYAKDSSGWAQATVLNRMTLGKVEDSLIILTDNGCYGYKTPIYVKLSDVAPPNLGITKVEIPETASNCGMGQQSVTITLKNESSYLINTIPVEYTVFYNGIAGGVVKDTIKQAISPYNSNYSFTFAEKADLSALDVDRDYVIRAIVNYAQDTIRNNDTCYSSVIHSFRVPQNLNDTTVKADYGQDFTINRNPSSREMLVWYTSDTSVIDTIQNLHVGRVYDNRSYMVKALGIFDAFASITGKVDRGDGIRGAPYYSANAAGVINYNRQQYLITAKELRAMGYSKGNINAISFYVDTLSANGYILDTFKISIGETLSDALPSGAFYTDVNLVYEKVNDTIKGRGVHIHRFPSYYWDGTKNLVIQTLLSKLYRADQNINNLVMTIGTLDRSRSSTAAVGGNVSQRSQLPQMQFIFEDYHCESKLAKVNVEIQGAIPAYDLGLVTILQPFENTNSPSPNETPIKVVVKNYGTQPIDSISFAYTIDNGTINTYTQKYLMPLASSQLDTIELGRQAFAFGKHSVKVIRTATFALGVDQPETGVAVYNDTLNKESSFCMSGTYTIGVGKDFVSFNQAVNKLIESGICSPVIFKVSNGTYTEQVSIPSIIGASTSNTITFKAENAGKDTLTSSGSYVLQLTDASNFVFDGIVISSTSVMGHVVELKGNANNNMFINNILQLPANATNAILTNLVGAYLSGNSVENTFRKNIFKNGNIGIYTEVVSLDGTVSKLLIDSNSFENFAISGAELHSTLNLAVNGNKFTSEKNAERGILIDKTDKLLGITNNEISLLTGNKTKQGIILSNALATNSFEAPFIANNMISLNAADSNVGLSVESANYVNIYYNTIKIGATGNSLSRAVYIGENNKNIVIKNNLLSNFCGGYVYYVKNGSSVTESDYNNYYVSATTGKFAYWIFDIANLAALKLANTFDVHSQVIEPVFLADDNLRLRFSDFTKKGFTVSVGTDIDGKPRPSMPSIGAYEYPVCEGKDAAMVAILNPSISINAQDGDSIAIKVKFRNDGTNSINANDNLFIKAYVKGIQDTVKLHYAKMIEREMGDVTIDLPKLKIPYGKIGEQEIVVFTTIPSDCNLKNDTLTTKFNVLPSYNIAYDSLFKGDTTVCEQTAQRFSIVIRNVGQKVITSDRTIRVGLSIPGRPDIPAVEDTIILSGATISQNVTYTHLFKNIWNIYPIVSADTSLKIKAWVKMDLDPISSNDTVKDAKRLEVKSYFRPDPPQLVGYTHNPTIAIPYATFLNLKASQIDNLGIRWYDSDYIERGTGTSFTTPMLFERTNYYLQTTSSKGCNSRYDTITVNVSAQPPYDLSCLDFVEPTPRVYMGHGDTVVVIIKNYGSESVSNFSVSFEKIASGSFRGQLVTETCTATILGNGGTYEYKFNQLLNLSEELPGYTGKTYDIRAWTDLNSDNTKQNDTVKRSLTPLAEVKYSMGCNDTINSSYGLDITNISFGVFNSSTPPLGNTNSRYLGENDPTKIFYKGYEDAISIAYENVNPLANGYTEGWVKVYVDWNRDAKFEESELAYSESLASGGTIMKVMGKMKIPVTALNGYTRMRVILVEDENSSISPCGSYYQGEIQDFKVYIRSPYQNNAIIEKITQPESIVQKPDGKSTASTLTLLPKNVKVLLRNLGSQTLTNVTIKWKYNNGSIQEYLWSGSLPALEKTEVDLGEYNFPFGATNFVAWIEQPNKDVDMVWRKDTIKQEFYRYHVFEASFEDDFDEVDKDYFYAPPQSTNNVNLFKRGFPSLTTLTSIPPSNPYVWGTSLYYNTYPAKNQSIVYSPIFNTGFIRPDTLSFELASDLAAGAYMNVQYLDYLGNWVVLGGKEAGWYDSIVGFTKSENEYHQCIYSLKRINGNIGNTFQLRFVFTNLNSVKESKKEGVLIDNFRLYRAKGIHDVGVVAIEPMNPRYKDVITPTVTIQNFGTETVSSIPIHYYPAGGSKKYIPITETYNGSLAPGQTITYKFSNGILIDRTFTDRLEIVAYTELLDDYYKDNDSTISEVKIKPLGVDAGIVELVKPSSLILAGTQQEVVLKLRNFGLNTIRRFYVGYVIDGLEPVTVTINLSDSINGWQAGETIDYRFAQKFPTSLGNFKIKLWVIAPGDQYAGNDSLLVRLTGSVSVDDVKADAITFDESNPNEIAVQFSFENIGSNAVNAVPVGYYINGDKSTLVRENFEGTVKVDKKGFYVFSQKLGSRPLSICAFTDMPTDNDRDSDTTCTITPLSAVIDAAAVLVVVEHPDNADGGRKVQLWIENKGNYLTSSPTVTITDKNTGEVLLRETVNTPVFPGDTLHYTFDGLIPLNPDKQYNLEGRVTQTGDINLANDVTDIVLVVPKLGIEEAIVKLDNDFWMAQNEPNPFANETRVRFFIPQFGEVKLVMYDLVGRVIFVQKQKYAQGEHSYIIDSRNLASGVYYYGIEFKGQRIMKKLIIQK